MLLLEDDCTWLMEQLDELTHEIDITSPSQWAEANRYMPPSVTPLAGFFDYAVTPFLREIVDCFDVRSSIREVNFMKGAQVGWTSGVLENAIGYAIAVAKSAPVMFLTADAELAKLRLEAYITPMIQQSGLADMIQSSDELSGRKNGKTDKKIEWVGGGYLLPFGALNANKLRSFSIKYLLEDEIDGYPEKVGKDGDPCKLAEARCKAYWEVRKILRGSTPLLKGNSRIESAFNRGDQRYYMVHCKHCKQAQSLRFTGETDGDKWGLVWERDGDGNLIPESVFYKCQFCGGTHKESDKTRLFAAGFWKATAKSVSPDVRSYHLSGLYSPAGMFSWAACVQSYLDAWDVDDNRVRDMEVFQEFYNNVLGKAFEVRSNKLRFETVSAHRRHEYSLGSIPNRFAEQYASSKIVMVTCAVDVHKAHLDVACVGWTRGRRAFVIDEWTLEGDCDNLDAEPWQRLKAIIEDKRFSDHNGRSYPIAVTLIDSGYNNDLVIEFCGAYSAGVYPILGRDAPSKSQKITEFAQFTTQLGTVGYRITVDMYKSRWAAALRRDWDGQSQQALGHFNAPHNISDARLKELTVETRKEKICPQTGKRLGWLWHRPSGSKNELWDLLMYNSAALDMVAWDTMCVQGEQEDVDWQTFWEVAETSGLYYEEEPSSVLS